MKKIPRFFDILTLILYNKYKVRNEKIDKFERSVIIMRKHNLITTLLLAAIILTLAGCNKTTTETTETATNSDTAEETAKTVLWEETCNMVSKTGDSEESPVIFIRAYDDGTYYASSSVEFPFGGYEADLVLVSKTEGNNGDIVYSFSVEGTDTEFTVTENTGLGGYTVSYNGEESFYGVLNSSEHFLVYEDTESEDRSDTGTLEAEATTEEVTEEATTEAVTEAATTEAVKTETSTKETTKAATKKTADSNNGSSSVSTATNNGSSSGSATTTTTAASNSSSTNSANSTVVSGNNTSSTSTSNSSNSGSGNTTSTSTNSSSSTTAHTHSYTPVYKTVHHDAVTGTRTVETPVYKEVPVTKTVYCEKCNICEQQGVTTYMYNQAEVTAHAQEVGHGNYRSYQYEEPTGETKTVLWRTDVTTETYTITEAYDEQVVDYYKCSCGATKK
jgi:hypothetical protein